MPALAVNCNQDQNDVGDHICLPVEAGGLGFDLAILYYRKGGGRWVHSLRSAEGGRVTGNLVQGNCAGILALADSPGPSGHWKISSIDTFNLPQ